MASDVPSEFVRNRRRAARWVACLVFASALVALGPAVASAGGGSGSFSPGAPGAGDPYFPLDGNRGYDVDHYDLEVTYEPATDLLEGEATIGARATQSLSRFNLDLQGLTVHSIEVDGRSASWARDGSELTVTPRKGLRKRESFKVEVRYGGVPETLEDGSGFIHTDDGTLVVGQPARRRRRGTRSTTIRSTRRRTPSRSPSPRGSRRSPTASSKTRRRGAAGRPGPGTRRSRWPRTSTTATIGDFDLRAYKRDGIRFWDAIDSDLLGPPASPRTGRRFAISQRGMPSYKRLQRTISVPSGGATVSFWVTRDTEPNWDFFFVEAHTVGEDDWTTLPDLNGHTSQDTGSSCPFWLFLHPFLAHYQTDNGDGTCGPTGDSGAWHAVSGWSDGYEQWRVDLAAFAGRTVELSLTLRERRHLPAPGRLRRRHRRLHRRRLDLVRERREHDGRLDGARSARRQRRAEPERLDRRHRRRHARAARHRGAARCSRCQDDVVEFLEPMFGDYPFSALGGIVDDVKGVSFALENQTRPIYGDNFFFDPVEGEDILVHELAHQWFGDSVSLAGWQHIWLNEGLATYAEWLWARARRPRDRPGGVRLLVRRHPRRRPVLDARDR